MYVHDVLLSRLIAKGTGGQTLNTSRPSRMCQCSFARSWLDRPFQSCSSRKGLFPSVKSRSAVMFDDDHNDIYCYTRIDTGKPYSPCFVTSLFLVSCTSPSSFFLLVLVHQAASLTNSRHAMHDHEVVTLSLHLHATSALTANGIIITPKPELAIHNLLFYSVTQSIISRPPSLLPVFDTK